MKAKIDELEGINDFKQGYQPRTNTVQDEKGDLFTDSHSILPRWKNHFSHLMNVHGVNDVRHTQINIAQPIVLELSTFEVEMAIKMLKRHKSPGTDQIPVLTKPVLQNMSNF